MMVEPMREFVDGARKLRFFVVAQLLGLNVLGPAFSARILDASRVHRALDRRDPGARVGIQIVPYHISETK